PLCQVRAQFLARVVETAHDRANRNAEHVGDFAVTQFRLGVEHKGFSLCLGQRGQRLVDQAAQVRTLQAEGGVLQGKRLRALSVAALRRIETQRFTPAALSAKVK